VTPAWSTRTGTKADFQRLKDLGVDCTGKVVIARYGGNCGYKARFRRPRARGAHHLPDPADTGYAGVRPEGGYANDLHPARLAQHHRLRRRPAPPFQPATKDARRSTRHRRPAADPVQPRLARRRRSSRG
jgi:N-acetylated-alpha-linked acidic dipeptidase